MHLTDVHSDIDINTVCDEDIEHRAIGRSDRFCRRTAFGCAGQRCCVGRRAGASPSVSRLPEVAQDNDCATRGQQDHGIQRQELPAISTRTHFPTSERRISLSGKMRKPGPLGESVVGGQHQCDRCD
jgi:hypothetical protein